MASQKHNRSLSVTSERSLSSLLDAVKNVGRKAKQKALKTVKSFTALLRKPCKAKVIIDSDRKSFSSPPMIIFDHPLADTEPTQVADKASAIESSTCSSSIMDIDGVSSCASSVIDINMPITTGISSEDDDTKEKIIKGAENKISRSSASSPFNGLLFCFSAESLQKRLWRSVVYAFYEERPKVLRRNNKKGVKSTYLAFSCVTCAKTYFRGTGSDSGSTGAMRDHIPQCWDEDVWNNAKDLKLDPAKELI